MGECTHNCSACGESCAKKEPESLIESINPYSSAKKVIGVVSGKGGVGKSLVTSLLAVLARRKGLSTAILDGDITGPSIPKIFGVNERAKADDLGLLPAETKTGIKIMSLNLLVESEDVPVIWRGPVIAGTVKQFWTDVVWGDLDCMFIDMPPGTGDVPLTVFQSIPVDGIIVVTSPQELVSMIVSKALSMAQKMDIPVYGLVENMSYLKCPDCGKEISVFGESHIQAVAEKYDVPLLGRIPIDPKLAVACDRGGLELFDGDWLDFAVDRILGD